MEILGKIFGTSARVKLMRLFLLNKTKVLTMKEIARRSRVSTDLARKELGLLKKAGFLRKRLNTWSFNPGFKYKTELENLLINTGTLDPDAIISTVKNHGKIKLVIVSGLFIKNPESRVDLLVVGDNLKRARVEDGIHKLEAEIGTELAYAVFETKEFIYRLGMYDKLVRDILDYPHEVILQAKDLNLKVSSRED